MSLPEVWRETTLGEVVDIKGGKRLPKGETLIPTETNHPYIRITDLDNNQVKINQLQFITDKTFSKISRYIVNTDDVIVSVVGTIGLVALIDERLNNANLTENCNKLIIKNLDTLNCKYLFYYLISRIGQYEINKNTVGAVQKKLPIYGIDNILITLPPLQEQKAIANILSSFDEKIELLKEQNETLEQMAQGVFWEWFVKFNYPNASAEMVKSELGEIPEGWRVYKLYDLVDTVNGYSYKGKELVETSDEALVTLKSFNRDGGFQTRGFKPFIGKPKESQEVKIGDLVVAHTDLTQDADVLGNPAFIFEDGGYNKMYITMDLVKVNSKVEHIDNAFLYYVMKDRRFKGHCVGYSNGTTVLHLSKKAIPEYEIALPEDLKLAKEFSDIAYTMTRKISNNINQIKILQENRDTLLPKLMSGEVRVKGFGG